MDFRKVRIRDRFVVFLRLIVSFFIGDLYSLIVYGIVGFVGKLNWKIMLVILGRVFVNIVVFW